jgi:putative hemolysin
MIINLLVLIILFFILVYFLSLEKALILLRNNDSKNGIHSEYLLTTLIIKIFIEIVFVVGYVLFMLSHLPNSIFYLIIILSILLIILAELVSDWISKEIPDLLFDLSKHLLNILSKLLLPGIWLLKKISGYQTILSEYNTPNNSAIEINGRSELKASLLKNQDKEERNILNKVLELSNIRVREVMRPRTEIVGVEINSTIEDVLDILIESGYSKIPVYEESLDNIRGIILANDLFLRPDSLSGILREVIFVPETKKCADMFREFSEKRISIAVAVDEFGGTAGILTMEDILEEVFGEIKDEYDVEEVICKQLDNNNYVISGKVEIDYIIKTLNLDIPQGDYATIGGFITFHAGRIPAKGDSIKIDKYKFHVLRSNQLRIDLVKLTILQD